MRCHGDRRLRLLATLALAGCAPEVTILDGDGGGATPGFVGSGAGTSSSGTDTSTCPVLTQSLHCPAACSAFVERESPDSFNYCTFPCDRDTPTGCRAGEECLNGRCLPGPCEFDGLCPPHFACMVGSHCKPYETDVSPACRMHVAPAGGCEADCDAYLELGGDQFCTMRCEVATCPTGFGCSTLLDQTICVPMCFVDADCPEGLGCGATGLCDVVL